MEFAKFLKDKRTEIENLGAKLTELKGRLIEEKSPPRWSGDVRELSKFVTELEEWIKSPQVKRSRELIEKLKEYANDNRSFKGLGEGYLITILESLEKVNAVILKIEDNSLKANASMAVLDKLQREENFEDLIKNIINYWESFKKFEKKAVQNEFLKIVKKDMVTSLVEHTEFSIEQVTEAESTLEKASNAFELLTNFGISPQAYIKTYKSSKSVNEVWAKADDIRRLLGDTNFQITKEVEEPFGEMKNILELRETYIKKENLTEISSGLEKIKEKIKEWRERVERKFNDEYCKTKILAEFAKLGDEIGNLSEEFKKKVRTSFDVNEIYTPYKKLREVKYEATKKLERQFSEDERKIIENLETADELVESMGKNFWVALKSLREKQLIKIAIRRV
ncbi:hypothetical protein J7M02_03295 [Candidatus Aerophobetes bacterium]|nr:hypothetical protein [Candidatus Aerophobetes bacterium]